MRIALYNPPVFHYTGIHYAINPPLGLPILGSVLHNAGHEVEIIDLEALMISPQRLGMQYAKQKERWPDVVGFTCLSQNVRGVADAITALRYAGFDRPIIVGGPHATLFPKEILDIGADIAVRGECEGNIVSIIESPKGSIIQGQRMPIEDIPAPLWEKHMPKPNQYSGNLPRIDFPEAITMWSRGCPHRCIFCANPVFRRQKIRRRPPENILEELQGLRRYNIRSLFVYDDELVGGGGVNWLSQVCYAIAPLGYTWKCQGRCSKRFVTKDLLQQMHDAGCRAIMWGIESFHEDILHNIRKGTTEEDIWHTLRAAHEVGIGNWAFLMVGNYGETEKHLAYTERQLTKAVREDLIQWRQVTVCTPTPGSDLYTIAQQEGWYTKPPETGPQMAQVYSSTPWLTAKQIKKWKMRLEAAR